MGKVRKGMHDPKMALHHRRIDLAQSDEIPEEGTVISSHSLTRM